MKLLSLAVLALFAALVLAFFKSPAQSGPVAFAQAGTPLFQVFPSKSPTNVFVVARTNSRSLFDAAREANRRRTTPQSYAPGVYEARPWTMIVVVPGPHPDDRCLVDFGGNLRMPTRNPGLELIPRTPAGK